MRTLWHDMLEEFPVFQGTVEQFAPGRRAPVAERGVRALRETVSGILIQMPDKGMGLRNNRKAFNFVFQQVQHVVRVCFDADPEAKGKPTQAPSGLCFREYHSHFGPT